MKPNRYIVILLLGLCLPACQVINSLYSEDQGVFKFNKRQLLTLEDLTNGFQFQGPLAEAALTMPLQAESPKHNFEGYLELIGEQQQGFLQVLRGRSNPDPYLPDFNFQFVQVDSYLVPVQRGLIQTEHENWNYFIEPGRVWYEPGDGDYSRASFPFALSWKESNAIHNGTMSFLFNDQ